ncbi:MAG: hypothetical protein C0631_18145 [Sedimenticola sp.]|nr:MAG: hypothetical protein C0631_18145 [Sedimenticola sp.]
MWPDIFDIKSDRPASMNRLLLILLLLSMPLGNPLAQSATPFFDIELLLFERTSPNAGNSEAWSSDTRIPFQPNVVRIQSESVAGYRLLPENHRQLSPDAYTLERSGRFKTLAHLNWRQPGLSKSRAKAVYISGGGLEGTVTISLSRFLHVDFDMLLNRFSPQRGEYKTYAFNEHRKMRSGELHYVDHPLIGALIKIERYDQPTPDLPDTEPQEGMQEMGSENTNNPPLETEETPSD